MQNHNYDARLECRGLRAPRAMAAKGTGQCHLFLSYQSDTHRTSLTMIGVPQPCLNPTCRGSTVCASSLPSNVVSRCTQTPKSSRTHTDSVKHDGSEDNTRRLKCLPPAQSNHGSKSCHTGIIVNGFPETHKHTNKQTNKQANKQTSN